MIKISKNLAKTPRFQELSIFIVTSPEFDVEWKNQNFFELL
jgi:hypothetical protein